MNDILGITDWLLKAPPQLLVPICCIVLGYVLRSVPKFPNSLIPLGLTIFGMVAMPFLMLNSTREPGPMFIWIGRNAMVGIVFAFLGWAAHGLIIRRLEKFIPGLSEMLGEDKPQVNVAVVPPPVALLDPTPVTPNPPPKV